MAFGRHWEWRGFGRFEDSLRGEIDTLPPKFPAAQVITDEYLWTPRCRTNVKLRLGDLKLKRFLRVERDLELWLEDPGENYTFPLGRGPLLRLFEALNLDSAAVLEAPLGREALLDFLERCEESVRRVAVSKSRQQFLLALDGDSAAPSGDPVTVELAEIRAPEKLLSVGLEHERLEAVERARDALALPGRLRRLNYFQALKVWAGGGSVLE